MSDDSEDEARGPVMLAATNMLKPPPAVIGSLNKEINLPRTVTLTTAIAVFAGAVAGFTGALTLFGTGLQALMYGPVLGGALGWTAVNLSPLRGESLATWIGLQARGGRRGRPVVNGAPVRLYVGIAPLRRTAAGRIRMLPGGIPVDAVRWDDRGVPRQEIPGSGRIRTGSGPAARLTASTEVSSRHLRPRRGRSR